jgi:hypothetical protein
MSINPTVAQLREQIAALDPTRPTSKLRKAELIEILHELRQEELGAMDQVFSIEQPAEIGTAAHNAMEDYVRSEDNEDMTGHWAEYGAGVDPTEPQVYQGAMHEAGEDTLGRLMREATEERLASEAVDKVISEELGDLGATLAGVARSVGKAIEPMGAAMRASAKQVGRVAYGGLQATVRSMGHVVQGRVVDTVLRTPNPDGASRVLLVVQHLRQADTNWRGETVWNETPHWRRTLHTISDVQFSDLTS